MGNAKMTAMCMLMLAGLLLPQIVGAIAIAPGNIDITFEPNAVKEYELIIINNEPHSSDITLYKKGGLATYITLPFESIKLKANEEMRIKFKANLPNEMPAETDARIGAAARAGTGGQISAIAAVESIITLRGAANASSGKEAIRLPKFLSAGGANIEVLDVAIRPAAENAALILDVGVKNTGDEDTEAYAQAVIVTQAGTEIVETGSELVKAGQKDVLSGNVKNKLATGADYVIDVTVNYGDNSVKKSVRRSGGVVADVPINLGTDAIIIIVIIFIAAVDVIILVWRRLAKGKV
jgi:hypothetical protein